MKKKIYKLVLISLFVLIGCEEIFYVDDISEIIVRLNSPSTEAVIQSEDIQFHWDAVENADYFKFQLASPNFQSANAILVDSTLELSHIQLKLAPNKYAFRVKAVNASYETSYSTNEFEVLLMDKNEIVQLQEPVNHSISNDSQQQFEWDPVAYASHYRFILNENGSTEVLKEIIVTNNDTLLSLDDGDFIWKVRAEYDEQFTEYSSRNLVIDTQNPNQPELVSPTNEFTTVNPTVDFSWNRELIAGSAEVDSLFVYKDSNLEQVIYKEVFSEQQTALELYPGTFYWQVGASDAAGNLSTKSDLFSFTIAESIAHATVVMIQPENNLITNQSDITFSWEQLAFADHYIVQIINNESQAVIYEKEISETEMMITIPDGSYSWRIKAENSIQETEVTEQTLTVDTTAPQLPTIISPDDNAQQHQSQIQFEFTIHDDMGTTVADSIFIYDDISLTNLIVNDEISTNFNVSLNTGSYYWQLKSDDLAGNTSGFSDVRSIEIVDNLENSEVVLLSPENALISNKASHLLSWEEVDGALQYQLQVFSVENENSPIIDIVIDETSKEIGFQDGNFVWKVAAINNVSSSSFSSRIIHIDTQNPNDPNLLSPTNNAIIDGSIIHFEWVRNPIEGTKETDSIFVYSDAAKQHLILKASSENKEWYHDFDAFGTYYWEVKAYDAAGNGSNFSELFEVTIQESFSSKTVELILPVENLITNSSTNTFTWNPIDNSDAYELEFYSVNTQAVYTSYNLPITTKTATLPDGTYNWSVIATLGNLSTMKVSRTIQIDTESAPKPTLSTPSNGQNLTDTTVTFTWDSAAHTVESEETHILSIYSDALLANLVSEHEVSSTSTVIDIVPGVYYWTVKTIDTAGNESDISSSFSFTVSN